MLPAVKCWFAVFADLQWACMQKPHWEVQVKQATAITVVFAPAAFHTVLLKTLQCAFGMASCMCTQLALFDSTAGQNSTAT
jgi:hypothetical protein